jgi:hypothetical protein
MPAFDDGLNFVRCHDAIMAEGGGPPGPQADPRIGVFESRAAR